MYFSAKIQICVLTAKKIVLKDTVIYINSAIIVPKIRILVLIVLSQDKLIQYIATPCNSFNMSANAISPVLL